MTLLSTGRAGKDYIDEITRLLNAWIQDSDMKHIRFKAIMVMQSLILQKPSATQKRKIILKHSDERVERFNQTKINRTAI